MIPPRGSSYRTFYTQNNDHLRSDGRWELGVQSIKAIQWALPDHKEALDKPSDYLRWLNWVYGIRSLAGSIGLTPDALGPHTLRTVLGKTISPTFLIDLR
jgi:hypothetical protein